MERKLIKALLCLLITVITIFITNEVKAVTFSNVSETYNDTKVVPYGKEITVDKSKDEEISIVGQTDVAELLGDNIIRINGVGYFEVTVKNTSTQEEEKIKFFAWNVYLKRGRFYTYTDVNRKKKSSIVYSKAYLATEETTKKKALKVKEHFFANGGRIKGTLDGKYITNYYGKKKAKYFDYSFEKQFVTVEVEKVSLNETNIEVDGIKAIKQLVATVEPSNATYKEVTWLSSNENIAKVDDNGNVTIKAAGEVTITAKTSNGKTASCKIKINKVEPTGITLNKTSLELAVSHKEKIIANISPDNATEKMITYTSSDNKIAKVNQNGEITAVSKGDAIITAKTSNGKTAECKVKSVVIDLLGISFKDKELTIPKGETQELSLILNPTNATIFTLEYKSSNEAVASVDSNGKVTGKELGNAKITVTANGTKVAECDVTVKEVLVEKVELNKDKLTIKPEKTETLKATITPADATNTKLTWSSSDESIVKVDDKGNITAIKNGEATITVATANGKKAECKVKVSPYLDIGDGADMNLSKNVQTQENAKLLWKFFIYYGFTENAAAGILGNLERESSILPWNNAGKDSDKQYVAKVDAGTIGKNKFVKTKHHTGSGNEGFGLAQWTSDNKKNKLYEYLKEQNNYSIASLQGQAEFLVKSYDWESISLDHLKRSSAHRWQASYLKGYASLTELYKNTKSYSDAAKAMGCVYCRSGAINKASTRSAALAKRVNKARVWYEKFKGTYTP